MFLNSSTLLSADTDWVFLGSPGAGAPWHYDAIYDPSWQAQITGRKRWDLKPPPECSHVCHPLSVIVEPGDVAVIDTHRWQHRTTILPPDLSISVGSEFYSTDLPPEYAPEGGYHVDRWDFVDVGRGPILY